MNDENIVDVITAACEEHADRIAFSCMNKDLSYRELDRLSQDFAVYLKHNTNLKAGDRIAVQLPNILQYPVVVLGALKAGLVIVNTNPMYSPPELEHQLNDAGARALVVLANTAASAAEVVPRTSVETVIVTELFDLHGAVKSQAMNFAVRYLKKLVPPYAFSNSVSFKQALKLGRRRHTEDVRLPENEQPGGKPVEGLAVLQYTGGTTGISKGAMLTHKNLISNMRQLSERLQGECPDPGEVMVAPLPMYHIYAFTVHLMYGLHIGLHNLLIPNPRDIPAFVKTLRQYRIAGMVGINTLYNALCANSAFCRLDFSHLKLSCAGGMALSEKTFRRWEKLTGCRILEGYGLTETSPVISCNSGKGLQVGTIGLPVTETQVRVIDDQGRVLGTDEAGELCVRGPQVMAGYWNNVQATQEVLDEEGWLRTGDIALIQKDGFIRIVDRIKDLIIVSGYNVFPAEIEEYVCRHPDIMEAAAVGIRAGDIGEKVKLFVVTGNPALSKQDVISYCRQGLAAYKVPRLIEFRESLPKSNVGKILRRELRDSA